MLSKEEVIKQASSYINQSIAGFEIENQKIDFKTSWYKLNESKGANEFVKDATAIANSFGPDGMIIIGFDEKNKELYNVSFNECGLRDSSQLPDLINKRVDRLFDFNLIETEVLGYNISIIHLPPSFDKPHVIRHYQTFDKHTGAMKTNEEHKIFIRRSSSTYPASKADLELMYYDRKNILPDYHLVSHLPLTSIYLNMEKHTETSHNLKGRINIIFENTGRRPVSLSSISLELSVYNDPSPYELIRLFSNEDYFANPIIIQSGELVSKKIDVISDNYTSSKGLALIVEQINMETKRLKVFNYSLNLTTGAKLNFSIETFYK